MDRLTTAERDRLQQQDEDDARAWRDMYGHAERWWRE